MRVHVAGIQFDNPAVAGHHEITVGQVALFGGQTRHIRFLIQRDFAVLCQELESLTCISVGFFVAADVPVKL